MSENTAFRNNIGCENCKREEHNSKVKSTVRT